MVAPLPGEIIYKGHRSYALMKSLQFGLLFSTSQGARANMNKQPSSADFKRTVSLLLQALSWGAPEPRWLLAARRKGGGLTHHLLTCAIVAANLSEYC